MTTLYTRRSVLKTGSLISLGMIALPRSARAARLVASPVSLDPDNLKPLVTIALESATREGASYAEVRLTHRYERAFHSGKVIDTESITAGIKALVGGYWGVAASPLWTTAEMMRLGKDAAFQATLAARGEARPIALAPREVVSNGDWTMPVEIDPFTVNPLEILDHLEGMMHYAERKHQVSCNWNTVGASFTKTSKTFAATDGAFVSQRLFYADGTFGFLKDGRERDSSARTLDEITLTAGGLEIWKDPSLGESLRKKVEEIDEDLALPFKPVDVGRFDVLFDARSVTNVLAKTIGVATELDRALGYEANASGTSYIVEPAEMIGTYRVGADGLTIRGNRTEAGGAATVKYDDEGVMPRDFVVVDRGILSGFQTTRESAGWCEANNITPARPILSNGCAYCAEGRDVPMAYPANLVVDAGQGGDYAELAGTITKGFAFESIGKVSMDMMQLNGLTVNGRVYELASGVKQAKVLDAGILFRSPELLKSLSALGNERSRMRFGMTTTKGEPPERGIFSVTAPPATFANASVIDLKRKA